jgi:hypothetical protein
MSDVLEVSAAWWRCFRIFFSTKTVFQQNHKESAPQNPLSDATGAPIRRRRGESVTRGDRRLRELELKARSRRSPASCE